MRDGASVRTPLRPAAAGGAASSAAGGGHRPHVLTAELAFPAKLAPFTFSFEIYVSGEGGK